MKNFFSKRNIFVLIIIITALSLGIYLQTRPRIAPGQEPLTDIQNIETLRAQFDQDSGKTRLIILASPTWGTCLAGARWVQSQLLAKYHSSQLRVYAVWIPMLWTDARETWNGTPLPDARVKHFWDGNTEIGKWFALEVDGYEGIAWDVYYLYGPDATWKSVPSHLVSAGGTMYDQRETLEMQLNTLLSK